MDQKKRAIARGAQSNRWAIPKIHHRLLQFLRGFQRTKAIALTQSLLLPLQDKKAPYANHLRL